MPRTLDPLHPRPWGCARRRRRPRARDVRATGCSRGSDYAGALLAAWVVAWVVVGFAILPYLTVVPAAWLIRQVEVLSTAEFVAAVIGLLLGLLMGLLLGFPLSGLAAPFGTLVAARRLDLPGPRAWSA